jgi:branched-chain amino acid transport system ATP-binding protein
MPERVRLGLARSFQITSILAGFTVLENVALAVQARSGSSFRFFRDASHEDALNREAMKALARFRLDERAHVPAGSLSHGEKRQLELAIAWRRTRGCCCSTSRWRAPATRSPRW